MYVNNNKMSARGPTFDGLYDEQIITQQDIISTNYVATNASNQYATSALNMDLTAVAINPTFSFKNSAGALTGTVAAAKVSLFSNSEMTTTTVTALTAQTTDTTAVVINNNSVDAALTVGKITPLVERGLGMQVTTQSVDKAALALTNTQSSSCSILQALAPNLPTTGKASVLIGKDNSTTGNSYTIGTVVDSPSTTNRLEINSFGETNPAMQIYKKATLATSATTGSVVVPGDLTSTTKVSSKSLVLYGTSSGSATIQAASITTTPYTLTLPNNLGTSGQVLTLGTPVSGVAPLSWTSTSAALTTQSAVFGRSRITNQTIPLTTATTILFDSTDADTNLGTVPISYDTGNGRFSNTFGNTTTFYIAYNICWSGNGGNREVWIERNGDDTKRYAFIKDGISASVNQVGGGFITIANGEYFTLRCYHNQAGTINVLGGTYDRSKIQIMQVPGSTIPEVNAALLGYLAGAQSIPNNSNTAVQWPTLQVNLGSTGLTYDGTNHRFTNNTGGILNILVTAGLTYETSSAGHRQIYIFANWLGGRSGHVTVPAVSGDITSMSTSVQFSIPVGQYFRILTNQTSGGALLLTTASYVQVSPIVSASALQSVSLTTPSSLFSISGSPAVGQNPELSFTTTLDPTGTGNQIVCATSPTITTPTIASGTFTGLSQFNTINASTLISGPITTSNFQSSQTSITITANNQTINLSNTSTFYEILASGSFTGAKIVLPNATTLTQGVVLHFYIRSIAPVGIYANNGTTLLVTAQWLQYYKLILNANTTTNGTWHEFNELRSDHYPTSNTGIEILGGRQIKFSNAGGYGVNVYSDPTQSVNYNWIYPTTVGTVGQVLTSSAGSTLTWSNALNNAATLAIIGGGHVIGTSSPSVNSTPTLTINGTQTGPGGEGTLRVTTSSINSALCASFLNANQGITGQLYLALGRSLTTGNCALPTFNYFGDNNSQNNYALNLYGKAATAQIFSPNTTATSTQASLKITGGTTTESLYVNGATTLQATTATSVTTNSIVVIPDPGQPAQTRQLTFDYGTRTPTLYWAVNNTSQDPAVTLVYPLYPGVVGFTNQHYDWQQVGKQYSFTLSIVIYVIQVLNYDMLCPFIDNCFPPTPAMGSYAQYETSTDIPYRFGTYIPAT